MRDPKPESAQSGSFGVVITPDEAWKRMVSTIETIARGSDHIRIDVFVPGG